MVRGDGTGCSGWSRVCDHAAAVPAVRRFLGAFISVPRQSGGLSSRMLILVRTVHTVQQTVEISQVQFLGWLLTRLLLCSDRCPGWVVQKTVDFRSCSLGVVQFFDKVVVPVGATTAGRAMLGSTMDTCSASSRVAFGRILRFSSWLGVSAPEVDSPSWPACCDKGSGMFLTGFAGLRHLAPCSHDCRQLADRCLSCSRVALGKLYIIFCEPPVFSAFSRSNFQAS